MATTVPETTTVSFQNTTGDESKDFFLRNDIANFDIQNSLKALDHLGVSRFSNDFLVKILHQSILFVIVIGRWMLPTASDVSRDQLSQILMVFIGVGADILEFVTETLKVKKTFLIFTKLCDRKGK